MIQIITLIDKLKSFPFGERIIVCSYKSYYKFFENEKDNNVLFNENKKKEKYKYNNGNDLQNGNKSKKYRSNKQNKIV